MEQEEGRASKMLIRHSKVIETTENPIEENNYRFYISDEGNVATTNEVEYETVKPPELCQCQCTCQNTTNQYGEEDFDNYRYYISGTSLIGKGYRKKKVTETSIDENFYCTCDEINALKYQPPVETDTYAPYGERGNDLRVYKCVVRRVQPNYKENYSFYQSK